jgi:hypothetical protein
VLKFLANTYILVGLLLYLFFFTSVEAGFLDMHILNILLLLIFGITFRWLIEKKDSYYNSKNLVRLYIPIALFSIISMNVLSFIHNGNFFVFSENDASLYQRMGQGLNFFGDFQQTWSTITKYYAYNDWGMMVFSGIIYSIFNHPLFLNFINFLLGVVIAKSMFSIAIQFMPKKYAFLAAFTFATSSYLMWFHSSGLKESVMITLIIMAFNYYYKLLNKRSPKHFILIVILLTLILFFRPAVSFLILASFAGHILFLVKDGILKILAGSLVVALIFFSSSSLIEQRNQFFGGESINELVENREKQGMIKGGVTFTYAVNTLSSLIGPLPTIYPKFSKGMLPLFSSGLIFRNLAGIFFLFGIYYVFKRKAIVLFPLVFYYLMEATSLTIILEGLELRKSLPHFFAIYLVIFWMLFSLETKLINKDLVKVIKAGTIIVPIIILYWNFR